MPDTVTFEGVRQHLRQCLRVRNERDDNYILFRFYDSRAFVDIVSTFNLQQLKEFFGPIHSFLLEHEDTKRMLKSQISNHQPKKNEDPLSSLSTSDTTFASQQNPPSTTR
jgi:hypothetical protein